MLTFVTLDSVESTNSYVSEHARELPAPCLVSTRNQTAGRGQRGNSWESEPGKNLTFTMLLRPQGFPAVRQFRISQAFALGVCDFLAKECGVDCKVKWPNDIYAGDRKICGILISHSLEGRDIAHTIAGAGININQEVFRSDAPNPVSVAQLTGRHFDIDSMLLSAGEHIRQRVKRIIEAVAMGDGGTEEAVHKEFMERLWRGDGKEYPFRDVARGEDFTGVVKAVEPTGLIHILDCGTGRERVFAFKEVEWLR